MALLTQSDIRDQYTKIWAEEKKRSDAGTPSLYCSNAEELLVQPVYLDMLRDLKVAVGKGAGAVLDVGCGAGRWVKFLMDRVRPASILGVDITQQSIDLIQSRLQSTADTGLAFRVADITQENLDLGLASFDLINIANVLFHIPEHDLYFRALENLRRHLTPGGLVFTTEYLPRTDMRTPWMQVRSRYNFEKLVAKAGLRIVDIRAFTIFNNDPMGLDGPDDGPRYRFNIARHQMQQLYNSISDAKARAFLDELQANIDRAVLAFCKERIADIDLPSQKLVALAAA